MTSDNQLRQSVICKYCQDEMELITVKTFPGNWPLITMIIGFVFCFLVVGPFVGIPLLLVGIYMFLAENIIHYCPSCGHFYKVLDLSKHK
ncbi:hypothetical protein MHK_003562 [Candidatus Magnetomorum sp. HK-1]|nr:hypothetical protein MHK_003562 [Candidatus Magnetomorum sp. HK-1]